MSEHPGRVDENQVQRATAATMSERRFESSYAERRDEPVECRRELSTLRRGTCITCMLEHRSGARGPDRSGPCECQAAKRAETRRLVASTEGGVPRPNLSRALGAICTARAGPTRGGPARARRTDRLGKAMPPSEAIKSY